MNVRISLIVGALGCCALAAAARTAPMSSTSFADKAATSSKAEIDLSRLALHRSQNDRVKQFAQTMIKDHEDASNQLESLAARENIKLPSTLPRNSKAALDTLRHKSGPALDRAYAQQMVRDHEKAVALFQKAANQPGLNQDLRDFAHNTLPTLQGHLQHAQELAAEVNGTHSPAAKAPHQRQQRVALRGAQVGSGSNAAAEPNRRVPMPALTGGGASGAASAAMPGSTGAGAGAVGGSGGPGSR